MKLDRVLHEAKSAAAATLFFLVCFLIILVLKKLFLAQYDVDFYGLSAAVFGALVIGKVVVVLDNTSAGNRFEETRAPWLAVLYKTLVYTLVVLLVVAAEKVFHAYRETGGFGPAVEEVWGHRDRNNILATTLCVGLSFTAYNLFAAINRQWDGGLVPWLLGRRET